MSRATHRGNKKKLSEAALNLPVDDMIHCLKERQPCGSGPLLLLSQLQVLSEQGTNPFECTGSDFERAYPSLYLLDSGHEEDREIKIE